jgi:hypothetical protein
VRDLIVLHKNDHQGLRKIVKDFGGPLRVAKMIATTGDANGITEHEMTALAFEESKKHALPGERPNSTFARWYSEPDQLELRKAIQVCKSTPAPRLLDVEPVQVGGDDATDINTDASAAYNQLVDMANELMRLAPTLKFSQAFAKVFTAPENSALANAAHRRPTASALSQFPA